MKDQFYLHFDSMPKGTAQQKRYNGATHTYFKDKKLMETEKEFYYALRPHAPKEPSIAPIRLSIWFYFDIKDRKKWKLPKVSKPDVDNFAKAFIDQMTKTGFWLDDSQITSLHLEKYYAEKASIVVRVEEWKEDKA